MFGCIYLQNLLGVCRPGSMVSLLPGGVGLAISPLRLANIYRPRHGRDGGDAGGGSCWARVVHAAACCRRRSVNICRSVGGYGGSGPPLPLTSFTFFNSRRGTFPNGLRAGLRICSLFELADGALSECRIAVQLSIDDRPYIAKLAPRDGGDLRLRAPSNCKACDSRSPQVVERRRRTISAGADRPGVVPSTALATTADACGAARAHRSCSRPAWTKPCRPDRRPRTSTLPARTGWRVRAACG